jgi:hypothetical protein
MLYTVCAVRLSYQAASESAEMDMNMDRTHSVFPMNYDTRAHGVLDMTHDL